MAQVTKYHVSKVSGGIRVRIPQKLDVVAFWSWNLDIAAFCPLKNCLGISMLQFFGLRISMSWFFGLGISMSWYKSPQPRFRFHCKSRKSHAKLFQLYC